MWKRRIGRALASFAIAGIGVVGMSNAAHATEGNVTFEGFCGGVTITIEGFEGIDYIEVVRNGVDVGTEYGTSSDWAASPGDEFSVYGHEYTHEYEGQGCYDTPLKLEVEHKCDGLILLRVDNQSDEDVSGFWYKNQQLEAFPSGETEVELPAEVGGYKITRNDLIWWAGYYEEPRGCDRPDIDVTFTDLCNKVRIVVTGDNEESLKVIVKKNGEFVEWLTFSEGSPISKEYDAVEGDEFVVLLVLHYEHQDPEYQEPELTAAVAAETERKKKFIKLGEHTFTPQDCELPVTGSNVSTIVMIGLLLIVGGAALHVVSRRMWPAMA